MSSESESPETDWEIVESPVSGALYGVVQTSRGPFAVGEEGKVLARFDGEWEVIIAAGPATRFNTLTDVEVTDDGKRIWFAGSSGALGYFDVEEGRKHDYSAPQEKTSTWEALAVQGQQGSEVLRVANGSGEVLRTRMDEDGCPVWETVVEPGGGSTMPALGFGPDGSCYAVDTSGDAYIESNGDWQKTGEVVPEMDGAPESDGDTTSDGTAQTTPPENPDGSDPSADEKVSSPSSVEEVPPSGDETTSTTSDDADPSGDDTDPRPDGGEPADGEAGEREDRWSDLNVANAQVDFFDIRVAEDRVFIAADDGRLFRYDDVCANWTPIKVGDEPLHAIGETEKEGLVAVGGGGRIITRQGRRGWTTLPSPTEGDLWSVAFGEIDVVVGDAGLIMERTG